MKPTTLLITSLLAAGSALQAQTIFYDSFGDGSIANTSDINTNVPARQSGSTSSTYTGSGANNVFHVSNDDAGITSTNAAPTNNMARMRNNEQVPAGGSNGFLSLDNNFSSLAGQDYTISFDLTYNKRNTDSTDQWVSFSIGDTAGQAGPNNTNSDFGILLRPNGVGNANDQLARFYADNVFNVANDYTTTPAFDTSYVNFIITISESGIGGPTVSVSADGTMIINNFTFDFENAGRYISFGTHLGSNSDTLGVEFADTFIDNLTVTIVPEPSTSALLGGLLVLCSVIFRRRK
jgi:hypothetical protein